ncbi:MAG: amino acid--tRNA ligase-related protein, partial [Sulfolobaceae archaeon]
MLKTHFISQIKPELNGETVVVAGWVHLIRDLGGKKFIILRDASGIGQIVVDKSVKSFERVEDLTQESVIVVKGKVKADPRAPRGAEIHAEEIEVINLADSPLPLDVSGKVKADLETRLRERVLDLRRLEMLAVLKIQNVVVRTFREVLYKHGFIEIFTPKIIAAATEGGAQLFSVIYFGKTAFLAQSPQLYKELLAGAAERVFEIAPAWRAE